MTASVRQENFADGAGSSSTIAITPGSAFVAGSAVHVVCTWESTTGTPTISDTAGNSYSTATNIIRDTGDTQSQCQFRANSVAGSAPTITVNFGSSMAFRGIYFAEISGVSATAGDGSNGQFQASPGTGANGVSSLTVTNANQPVLLNGIGFQSAGSSSAPSAGTGFTSATTGWGFGGTALARAESQRYTDTTGHAATFTAASNVAHLTNGFMFDEATGAAAVQPKLTLLGVGS